ncbi:type VII secretion target [Micromonospora endophytica]|uniref:Uncharacterized protein n=1 Tax=Micromonospora endophytica TaxID=515350 RepID=A0A2W2D4B8_9ACTN|nr:type VII secretion target [Micromonospora endophytica]PZF98498.1 hypothetical protein C1I93_08795 [Micromonospora endophytica]RIW46016.1 hypothetical protein D3H59_13425 [Micromonospora endophytica]BCJ60232.1 hypothetical protein Jiend_36540 [Micromonospora endophytica]
MVEEELTVQPELLRRVGRGLGDTGHRLAYGLLAGVPGLTAPAPQWSAAGSLAALEEAVHGWSGRLGARIVETGAALRAAAGAYDSVDARAATRLSGLPR